MGEIARDREFNDAAFETFAMIYPHEAYHSWPERFVQLAERTTGKSREIILKVLEDTR